MDIICLLLECTEDKHHPKLKDKDGETGPECTEGKHHQKPKDKDWETGPD